MMKMKNEGSLLAGMGVRSCLIFSPQYLTEVEWLLCKSFCIFRLSLFIFFSQKEKYFLGIFTLISIVISVFLTSPACLGYIRQKRNLEHSPQVLGFLTRLPSYLNISESSQFCFICNIQHFYLFFIRGMKKSVPEILGDCQVSL